MLKGPHHLFKDLKLVQGNISFGFYLLYNLYNKNNNNPKLLIFSYILKQYLLCDYQSSFTTIIYSHIYTVYSYHQRAAYDGHF